MKRWKIYLSSAALATMFFSALFFFGLNKEEKNLNPDSSQRIESESKSVGRQEGEAPSADVKRLATLKNPDIPIYIQEDIPEYIKETEAWEDNYAHDDIVNITDENRDARSDPPEMDRLTKDYHVPESAWEGLLESFVSINDLGNKQEVNYKISKLMDMGTTMLLDGDCEKSEQAFRAVIEIDAADADVMKWARMGLVQSLEGQGKNDEAIAEKSIAVGIYADDEIFFSLMENRSSR